MRSFTESPAPSCGTATVGAGAGAGSAAYRAEPVEKSGRDLVLFAEGQERLDDLFPGIQADDVDRAEDEISHDRFSPSGPIIRSPRLILLVLRGHRQSDEDHDESDQADA